MKTAGEFIINALLANGVKRIFGLPGDSLNAVTESIRTHSEMEWVHVRHEEVAAFAAGAEAHLTEKLAVCAGSCGPGNLHLINGLFDCHRSRVPVLAIAAQIPTPEIGSGYFQETHPEILFKECSHYCEVVTDPAQLPRILAIAMRTAIAKRGVAVVVIPGDIALKECDFEPLNLGLSDLPLRQLPAEQDLKKAAVLINQSRRIVLLAGAGCKEARSELIAISQKLNAPVVHALRGKEYLEYENPNDVGMTGLLGFSSGYHVMMDSDLVFMVGTDFPYQQFFPKDARFIQIDIRGEQIGRRAKVDIGLIGTSKDTLAALLLLVDQKQDDAFLQKSLAHYQSARKDLDDLAKEKTDEKLIHPQYVTKCLDELASDDAIFTCDVGTPTIWASRYLRMNGRRRLLGSFVHGSMAGAMPQGIGAQILDRKRQVIAMCGDGGLAMLMGDLLTLKQMKLPLKLIVFNNNALGFVELEMKAAGLLTYATDLVNPDFAAMTAPAGLKTFRVEKAAEVKSAIAAALSHDGPALVDIVVARQELSMPPTISADQVKGFGIYMVKAILSGRGDELVDLLKTNVLR